MKKIMILLCSLFILAACSKNDDSSGDDYYIRFKVDGELVEYKKGVPILSAVWFRMNTDNMYSITMTGSKTNSSSPNNLEGMINIIVYNNGEIQPHITYLMHDPVTSSGVGIPRIVLTYANNEGKVWNAAVLRTDVVQVLNDAAVRFEEIGSNHVRGNFSGVVIDPSTLGSPKQITDGEFYLELYRSQE